MANLKKLVFRCYTYHRSEYLLRFCSYLAQYPHDELEYVNNWDSTTSLYHKSTGKLLVTFRNENMVCTIYMYVHACVRACVRACVCLHIYIYIYVCVYISTDTYRIVIFINIQVVCYILILLI